jgi:transcriptional regulator with GAF, ATPase, and Fis domain
MQNYRELRERIQSIKRHIETMQRSSVPADLGLLIRNLSKEASSLETIASDLVPMAERKRLDRILARLASHFLSERSFSGFCRHLLDDLIAELEASSGAVLAFTAKASRAEALAVRDRSRSDSFSPEHLVAANVLSEIRRGQPWAEVEKHGPTDGTGDSVFLVPLRVENEVVGVIQLAKSPSTASFTEEERSLLLEVSRIVSVYWAASPVGFSEVRPAKSWQEIKKASHFQGVVTPLDRLLDALEKVALVGPSNATVLIEGETGTGKELIADAIARSSKRAARPYAVVDCASIPEALLESELFGHERGAFTSAVEKKIGRLEALNGGTVLLDEIGELPLALQPKLLRFLEYGEIQRVGAERTIKVDVRVIAATNRRLEAMVREGRFREDLFFRLNVVPITVPPLRERRESIDPLVKHFIQSCARERGVEPLRVDPEVTEILRTSDWPGNVRQLKHLIERMVVLARGDRIRRSDLPPELLNERTLSVELDENPFRCYFERIPTDYGELKRTRKEMQRVMLQYIERLEGKFVEAILAKDSNVSRAALEAGIHRTLIYRILRKRPTGEPGVGETGPRLASNPADYRPNGARDAGSQNRSRISPHFGRQGFGA